jgi:hypothetical protein
MAACIQAANRSPGAGLVANQQKEIASAQLPGIFNSKSIAKHDETGAHGLPLIGVLDSSAVYLAAFALEVSWLHSNQPRPIGKPTNLLERTPRLARFACLEACPDDVGESRDGRKRYRSTLDRYVARPSSVNWSIAKCLMVLNTIFAPQS